jgi:hypothetical protein
LPEALLNAWFSAATRDVPALPSAPLHALINPRTLARPPARNNTRTS